MLTVAGLVPFTIVDYPGKLAAVLFFQGCPLRCPYCHNPALQTPTGHDVIEWDDVWALLTSRKGRLDGVVFSGGEPLMYPEIVDVARRVRDMGYSVGIHTSGQYPDRLREVLPYINWVGLDVKFPWAKYDLVGVPGADTKVQESLDVLLKSGVSFEARTTCDPRYLKPADVLEIAQELSSLGVATYALQKYRTFDADVNPPQDSEIESFFRPENLSRIQTIYPGLVLR